MSSLFSFMDVEPFNPALLKQIRKAAEIVPVRRPLWGLEVAEETHASLQVFRQGSSELELEPIIIPNSSALSGEAEGTSNFLIS